MKLQKPKGTVDILPEESAKWIKIENLTRNFFKNANYHEIRTPIFEDYGLFARSSGEESDVVQKEMYDFMDKGDRHIALRPEGTAGVVRSFVENKLFGPEHNKPVRLYYIAPMFRYERPQAGRQRQFHQIGVESFGSSSPLQDVEVIMLGYDLLNKLGVKNFELHLNSLGNDEVRTNYKKALVEYFTPLVDQLSDDSKRRLTTNPLRILDSKDPKDIQFVEKAPKIEDYLDDESKANLATIKQVLTDLGVNFEIDNDLVRGLDYYTGTIFEFMVDDTNLWQNKSTILGGGRYDKLVEEFSGPATPAVGFGIGLERLMLVLNQQNPAIFEPSTLDVYIANIGENSLLPTIKLVEDLRRHNISAEYDVDQRKLKNQFKSADRQNAKYVIAIGDDEVEQQRVNIKELASGTETAVDFANIIQTLQEKLERIKNEN